MHQPAPRGLQGAQRRLICPAVALLAIAFALIAPGAATAQEPPALSARAWTLVDAEDGEVLAAKRPRQSYPVASTTKLMTALVARKQLRLGETVVAPAYAALPAESLLGLVAGERIEVRDLLLGLLLASGNDAAVALAEASSGSVDRFVAAMNREAERLGLDDTSYSNPIGLDEPGNFSSARDLVELADILREDRVFARMFDLPSATLESGAQPRTIENRNTLVQSVDYVDGVKTGHTLGAGYVLVGSAERDDVELISAVLGAGSESQRDADTLALLEYGFSLYRSERALRARDRVAEVALADQGADLALEPARNVDLTIRRGQEVETTFDHPAEVEGPVERGARLGEALVSVDGEVVERVALVAATAAPGATLLERFDGAVPGPRAVAWIVGLGGIALIAVAALALFDRARRPARR